MALLIVKKVKSKRVTKRTIQIKSVANDELLGYGEAGIVGLIAVILGCSLDQQAT